MYMLCVFLAPSYFSLLCISLYYIPVFVEIRVMESEMVLPFGGPVIFFSVETGSLKELKV